MRTWSALIVSPTLVLVSLATIYALVTPSCERQDMLALHAVVLLSVALSLLFTFLAWQDWRKQAEGVLHLGRFLAGVATLSGLFSTLSMLAQWLPLWLLSPCAS